MSEVSEMVPGGHRPVQIVKIDDDSETHNFILDEEALNEILNKDNIRDKPVCILSVAGGVKLVLEIQINFLCSGAFRKGKSFLLNFMLRYLESLGSEKWLGENDKDLSGFHWR